MGKFVDLTGRKFGRWTVIDLANRWHIKDGVTIPLRWRCRCDCGKVSDVIAANLTQGRSMSCGCLSGEITAARNAKCRGPRPKSRTHGLTHHYLYSTWGGIKTRCYNKNSISFTGYGARGIGMCAEWKDNFLSFYSYVMEHLGDRPDDTFTLDRVDVNRDYEPGNIRWADAVEQTNNARSNIRITFNGETLTLAQWCRRLNLKYHTIRDRICRLSWPVEQALTTPAPQYDGTNKRVLIV